MYDVPVSDGEEEDDEDEEDESEEGDSLSDEGDSTTTDDAEGENERELKVGREGTIHKGCPHCDEGGGRRGVGPKADGDGMVRECGNSCGRHQLMTPKSYFLCVVARREMWAKKGDTLPTPPSFYGKRFNQFSQSDIRLNVQSRAFFLLKGGWIVLVLNSHHRNLGETCSRNLAWGIVHAKSPRICVCCSSS